MVDFKRRPEYAGLADVRTLLKLYAGAVKWDALDGK